MACENTQRLHLYLSYGSGTDVNTVVYQSSDEGLIPVYNK